MGNFTEHFNFEDFFVDNEFSEYAKKLLESAPDWLRNTLFLLAENILESVRHEFPNVPLRITSGYRDKWLNDKVAKTVHSLHSDGIACDFTAWKESDKKYLFSMYAYIKQCLVKDFGELILYEDENGNYINIHVSLKSPRVKPFATRLVRLASGETINRDIFKQGVKNVANNT